MAEVDLIIPARNEAQNIPALFKALNQPSVRPHLRNIIIADNGSTDSTADLAKRHHAIVIHEPKPGYGQACLAALQWIESQPPPVAVAFLDADLSDDPEHLPRLIQAITQDSQDLAMGSRTALAEPGSLEPHQRFGNALACWLIGLATATKFRDLGPMRVVRWEAIQSLGMQDTTWGWIVEMNFKAAKQNLRIVEIDVPYRKRHAGKSKISGSLVGSWKAGTKIISTIAELWWTHRKSKRDHAQSH